MISHKNIVFSVMQGFITGPLNTAVAPVSSFPNPILLRSWLMMTMPPCPSPRDPPVFQFHWSQYHCTTAMGYMCFVSARLRLRIPPSSCPDGT